MGLQCIISRIHKNNDQINKRLIFGAVQCQKVVCHITMCIAQVLACWHYINKSIFGSEGIMPDKRFSRDYLSPCFAVTMLGLCRGRIQAPVSWGSHEMHNRLTALIIFGKMHFLLISENEFFHEMIRNGMTSFMKFMK